MKITRAPFSRPEYLKQFNEMHLKNLFTKERFNHSLPRLGEREIGLPNQPPPLAAAVATSINSKFLVSYSFGRLRLGAALADD